MVQAIQVLRFHLLELEKVSKKNLNLNYPPPHPPQDKCRKNIRYICAKMCRGDVQIFTLILIEF